MNYDIPDKIQVRFDPEMNSGLTSNFLYRIIWVSIAIGHIRDQYFTGLVWDFVHEIEEEWPLRLDAFLYKVQNSDINVYGRKSSGQSAFLSMDINWWTQVWERLYYKKDIELEYTGETKT